MFATMSETELSKNPADRLIRGLGGRAAVATRFNISIEAVRLWLKKGIPPDRALEVEEATVGTEFPVTARDVLEYARDQRLASA